MSEKQAGWLGAFCAALVTVALATAVGYAFFAIGRVDPDYGWTYGLVLLFATPVIQGVATSYFCRSLAANPDMQTHNWAALSAVMLAALTLFIAVEGIVCAIMALPLWIPFCMLGAYLVESRCLGFTTGALVILPLSVLHDFRHEPAEQRVETSIVIDAPVEKVWPLLKDLNGYDEPIEWLFRIGVAYPIGTKTKGNRRYCKMSTGDIVEHIEEEIPNRKLTWRVLSMPDTMVETSPYGKIHPPHLHGVFVLRRGGFTLEPLSKTKTRLIGFSTYTNAMAPEIYWDIWCRKVVSDVHHRVMSRIEQAAEH